MNTITRYALASLVAALPVSAKADQRAAAKVNDGTWTGTLTAVSEVNKSFTGEHGLFTKTFKLGENCSISTLEKKKAALGDLRPGEKVTIHYHRAEGVLIANRIAERPLRYTGTVHSVDQKAGILTMEEAPLYRPFRGPRTFRIASDCKLFIRNEHGAKLADLRPGDRISVLYGLPGGSAVAYRIKDSSLAVVGKMEAIDMSTRTVRAKDAWGEKRFAVGKHCQIMLSDHKVGSLKDLVAGHTYQFTYEDVNGVNVLDRVAPAQGATPARTAAAM